MSTYFLFSNFVPFQEKKKTASQFLFKGGQEALANEFSRDQAWWCNNSHHLTPSFDLLNVRIAPSDKSLPLLGTEPD